MYYATMQILVRGEADIPEDRLRYAEVMYDVFYLNKKKQKKHGGISHPGPVYCMGFSPGGFPFLTSDRGHWY